MTCQPVRFGVNNLVEIATLTASPEPINDLDQLKNEWRARQAKWTDFSNSIITVEGVLDEPQYSDFFSIPGSNLTPIATVKLELFATDISTTDLLQMNYEEIAMPLPLGVWRAGIDPYGVEGRVSMANIFTKWFDTSIEWQRFKLYIDHGYSTEIPVANTTPRQDDVAQIVSLESESGTVTNRTGETWTSTSDGTASGSAYMLKAGTKFYRNPDDGPRIDHTFTASASGAHKLWARVKSISGGNSFYTVFDGVSVLHILPVNGPWEWVELRTVTLTAEVDHTLRIAARDYDFSMDKVEIRPTDAAEPSSTGETESSVGTVDSANNVSLRMLMIGEKVELDRNFSHGNAIQFLNDPDLQETVSGYYVPGKLQQEARQMSLQLNMMSESDRLKMVEMEITNVGKPFLVSAYPGESSWVEQAHTMLGMFDTPLSYTHRTQGIFGTKLNIMEV